MFMKFDDFPNPKEDETQREYATRIRKEFSMSMFDAAVITKKRFLLLDIEKAETIDDIKALLKRVLDVHKP